MFQHASLRLRTGSLLGTIGLMALLPLEAQVVINEISASSSDRLLRRTEGSYPVLGLTRQWQEPDFDDGPWKQGVAPFGFGTFPGVAIGTDVALDMQNRTPALYLRKTVWVSGEQASSSAGLELQVRFNDGFLLFINGREVLRRNLGLPGMYVYRDQTAFNPNENPQLQTFDLGAASQWLRPGANVIAIQGHNAGLTLEYSARFLIQPVLRWAGGSDIVSGGDTWRYFAGLAEPSGGLIDYPLASAYGLGVRSLRWTTGVFDDSGWPLGAGPIGIETATPPDYVLGTNLSASRTVSRSIYLRYAFSATPEEVESGNPLRLNVDYDDGLVIYLNGVEIMRRNLGLTGVPVPYDATATTTHNANGDNGGTTAYADETVFLPKYLNVLRSGTNILAIQLHRVSLQSSDSIVRPTLQTTGDGQRVLVKSDDSARYFVGTEEPVAASPQADLGLLEEAPDSEGDWVELFNMSPVPALLDGWSLSDNAGNPRKWSFPSGVVIPGNGYLVVMATGLNLNPADGTAYHHTGFSLSADGEYLGLVNAEGAVVSALDPAYPRQDQRYGYARSPSGAWGYTITATPGGPNAGPYLAAAPAPPVFSVAGGFHDAPVSLSLSTPAPGAAIRYTLDGREPGSEDPVFGPPLALSSNTVVRARVFTADTQPSRVATQTYLFHQSAAIRSLPAIMLGGDPRLIFFGANAEGGGFPDGEGIFAIKGGIYVEENWESAGDQSAFNLPGLKGRCSEKPASFEYLPVAGSPLAIEAGLRIAGSQYSRPKYVLSTSPGSIFPPGDPTRKPSLKLSFRSELDKEPLQYPFFPGSEVDRFEDLRIRAGKNDIDNPFVKDELMRRIFLAAGQESSVGTFATLHINGVYKGYYNLCEQLREGFMKEHHDSEAAWDVLEVNEFDSGDAIRWNEMLTYLRTADLGEIDGYEGVHNHLDVDNFIDYILVNSFAAMWDWPNNNWVAARERTDQGRWRFYMWDAEGGFGAYGRPIDYNSFIEDLIIGDAKWTTNRHVPAIYTLLSQSPEFRLRFADRVQKQMFDNGALVKERIRGIYEPLRDAIDPVMRETIGQPMDETFYSTWIAADTRRNLFFTQLAGQNLWPSTLAPVFSSSGGVVSDGFALSIGNPNADGVIHYTTDGTDPRLPGGTAAGQAYSSPVIIHGNTTVLARVRASSGEWGPVREALFLIPAIHPEFIPQTSADWNVDANWTTFPNGYPDGNGVSATIPAAPAGDRNVNLTAAVTIGSLEFPQNAATGRNRVRDVPAGTGNSLTFSSPDGARISVGGTGVGYVEFEVTSGVTLASQLELNVTNIVGNADNGALRLRAGWSGSGGLTKTGPGVASLTGEGKVYTGPTLIEEGVLLVTGPASPAGSSSVNVSEGGQMRLISAGNPRIYPFASPIYLAGYGRGAEIPDAVGQGKLGALRFDPGTESNHGIVSCAVVLTGPADIHVDHSSNRLECAGPLSGPYLLTKTGGGILTLSHDNSGHVGMIDVVNGTLELQAPFGGPVVLNNTGILTGYGSVGRVSGAGHANIGQCVLRATAVNGPSLSVVLAQSGSPVFGTPATAANGILWVTGGEVVTPTIDVYLSGNAMRSGEFRRGVLAVPYAFPLADCVADSTLRVFVPDASGTQSYGGSSWTPASGVRWTTVPDWIDSGSGRIAVRIVELRLGGDPVTFEEWRELSFTDPDDLADPTVSGPLAEPEGDGITNLMRYALAIPQGAQGASCLPVIRREADRLVYVFHFDPALHDIRYRVEATPHPGEWSDPDVVFDSLVDPPEEEWNSGILTLRLPIDPGQPRMFYRLRVSKTGGG